MSTLKVAGAEIESVPAFSMSIPPVRLGYSTTRWSVTTAWLRVVIYHGVVRSSAALLRVRLATSPVGQSVSPGRRGGEELGSSRTGTVAIRKPK